MQQQLFSPLNLLALINTKPFDAKAFRQGKQWATEKRRQNQAVTERIPFSVAAALGCKAGRS